MFKNKQSVKDLNEELDTYYTNLKNALISPISEGQVNKTFLAQTPCSQKYILQKIHSRFYQQIDSIIHNHQIVQENIPENILKTPRIIKSNLDQYFIKTNDGSHWRLLSYLGKTITNNNKKDALKIAAKALGYFHKFTQKIDPKKINPHLRPFRILHTRIKDLEFFIKSESDFRFSEDKNIFTLSLVEKINKFSELNPKSHFRVCHQDPKVNNFILPTQPDTNPGLIDFDTIDLGHIEDDIADAIRSLSFFYKEISPNKVFERFWKNYLKTYPEIVQFISFEKLHHSLAAIPLELSIRYLENQIKPNKHFQQLNIEKTEKKITQNIHLFEYWTKNKLPNIY